ncbi:MAG TPA: hypothetical protein VEH29_07345, partial [Acidimicrobiales bacterium]|nr:hypothetical protein [Acidimicrobiales bacterium]
MSEPESPTPTAITAPPPETRPPKVRRRSGAPTFDRAILRRAFTQSFVKLDPRHMVHNPVMFVVELGSAVTTIEFIARPDLFVGVVTAW